MDKKKINAHITYANLVIGKKMFNIVINLALFYCRSDDQEELIKFIIHILTINQTQPNLIKLSV